jgi:hypothetical protein
MKVFQKSNNVYGDAEALIPEVKWIPYRENGEVKYMRADDEEAQDFTVTGRAAKANKPSAWANMTSGSGATPAQLLPERYTDDTLIPAIVTNVVLSVKPRSHE